MGIHNSLFSNVKSKFKLYQTKTMTSKFTISNYDVKTRMVCSSEKLDDMKQDIMDQMEADGILVRPEDVGVTLTHVHPSFMVPKMDDGIHTGEYRLVTNLQSLSPYIKPTRVSLPTIVDAFRKLGKWKYMYNE